MTEEFERDDEKTRIEEEIEGLYQMLEDNPKTSGGRIPKTRNKILDCIIDMQMIYAVSYGDYYKIRGED